MVGTPSNDASTAVESPTSPQPKRRKIRKGTQSCWECKRRKIRCTFAAPGESVCDGCRSRSTNCVSQEFDDETESTGRVGVVRGGAPSVEVAPEGRTSGLGNADSEQHNSSSGLPWPGIQAQSPANFQGIANDLRAAFPSRRDLDVLRSIPLDFSVLFHGIVCRSYADVSTQIASPSHMLQLPPPGSHPILIARRLLSLATLLQSIPPTTATALRFLSMDYRIMMARMTSVVNKLVTSNDELVASLEGIECVMHESMYFNNAGNLRRSWLVNRKAIGLAQIMGLHKGRGSSSVLEEEARRRIEPDWMWCRLICTDRYLSLMLGLPQISAENDFARLEVLEKCAPLERMERMMAVAGGLILERNSCERTDVAATTKIDKMLREAAELMPPQWWAMTPGSTMSAMRVLGARGFDATLQVMNQFTHRHLLVQLHLPYLLLPSSGNPRHDYSKLTAANASREIISTWISFRTSTKAPAYCRGVDFITFIASTTLCLVHIKAHCQRGENPGVMQSLQHQRLGDRGLLERTLALMQEMAREDDVVAKRIAGVLGPLLDTEEKVSKGSCFDTSASLEEEGNTTTKSTDLRIEIPHLGTIKIECFPTVPHHIATSNTVQEQKSTHPASHAIFTFSSANTAWLHEAQAPYSDPQHLEPGIWDQNPLPGHELGAQPFDPGLAADDDGWVLQGVDMALFGNFTQGISDLTDTGEQHDGCV